MPWTLFWQIIMLMLVIWLILNGLLSAYYTQRSLNRLLESAPRRSDGTIISSSNTTE